MIINFRFNPFLYHKTAPNPKLSPGCQVLQIDLEGEGWLLINSQVPAAVAMFFVVSLDLAGNPEICFASWKKVGYGCWKKSLDDAENMLEMPSHNA